MAMMLTDAADDDDDDDADADDDDDDGGDLLWRWRMRRGSLASLMNALVR
jgi:hypothetical protein